MVQGGVTTMADMYYFEDEVARGAQRIGMRGIFGETVLNAPAPDAKEPYGGIAYALKFIQEFHGDPLITPAFAPHAPYTVDAEHLRIIQKEADARDAPILMHVAEMPDEVTSIRRDYNKTPVEYLDSIGLLTRRLVAAHCIFATDSDIALLKARDVGVAHNMVANIKSAKGVAPAWKMFKQGVRVGLGTDGPMSGNTLDIIGQLGYVAKVQKLANHDRNIMPATDVVEMATMGGARALHMEDRIGSLETGKLADLIVLDRDSTTMTPFYDVYSTMVYAASAHDVTTTIIQGPCDHAGSKNQDGRCGGCAGTHARPQRQNRRRSSAGNKLGPFAEWLRRRTSLIAQCQHGIDPCGAAGWKIARQGRNHGDGGNGECNGDGIAGFYSVQLRLNIFAEHPGQRKRNRYPDDKQARPLRA